MDFKEVNFNKIPGILKKTDQWILWKTISRGGNPTKVPYSASGKEAKSNDPLTWTDIFTVIEAYASGNWDGPGFMFSADDEFVGVDLDGCRDPQSGKVADWAREIINGFDTYSEISPSQTGVKLFMRGKSPFDAGKKVQLSDKGLGGKEPGIEIYEKLRYFAVTGWKLAGISDNLQERTTKLQWLSTKYFQQYPALGSKPEFYSGLAVVDRARKYLAKMPSAVSGQSGHNATFHAACLLVCGFGLDEQSAFLLLAEWNKLCDPPWTERELRHKIQDAGKQPGDRNFLRNIDPKHWDSVPVPKYEIVIPRSSTLKDAAQQYLASVDVAKSGLIEFRIGDLDYAIGGGVELSEMVIIAGRPSHGKSSVGLQLAHVVTEQGLPALLISEEMSALALGKRTVQYASDVPQEHWGRSKDQIAQHLDEHFGMREACYLIESCGTATNAVAAIEHFVEKGVKVAIIDYAQLLTGRGKGRYEQITSTSQQLRQAATRNNILLVALCQLNREIENRKKFVPMLSDLKDSGALEQDADVVMFVVWPHRINPDNDPSQFVFFISKNRNRPINQVSVTCKYLPSRQMVVDDKLPLNPLEFFSGDLAETEDLYEDRKDLF